jgi:hypothetical protein
MIISVPPTPAPQLPTVVQLSVGSVARAALTSLGGWFVAHGYASRSQADQLTSNGVALVLFGVTALWIWRKNRQARANTVSALNAAPPVPPAE